VTPATTSTSTRTVNDLGEERRRFFEAFGFLVLRGYLADDVEEITEEFEARFQDAGVRHQGTERSTIIPFIDARPRLRRLIEDPRIDAVFSTTLGPDWSYFSSDGNCYVGDTAWHPDGNRHHVRFVKLAVYLDPVDASSGALRVIPGSHRLEDSPGHAADARAVREAETLWGIGQDEVPAFPLVSRPGDVVAFNANTVHGSWGGSARRRMFTMNAFTRLRTPEQVAELREAVASSARFWKDSMHEPALFEDAPPERLRRLQDVLDNQDHLPALAAEARRTMDRPSNH
jgi:hypothetical protein